MITRFLTAVAATMLLTVASLSHAQNYPSKPVRIVVPFPAGGVADIMARTVGQKLSEQLKQPFIVENRAGASAIIGSEYVARAAPDGYTLLLANLPVMSINSLAYTGLPYDPRKDFAPISMIADQPYIIAVSTSVPAKNLAEFVALARSKPGELTHGSASSSTHLASELFKLRAGIKMLHVPYKGSAPAINDLIGGQITMLIDPVITLLPHVRSGKLRALAVTSAKRSPVAPEIPSYAEYGLTDLDMTSWQGLVAPAGTPKEILDKLHGEIVKATQTQDVKDKFSAAGVVPVGSSPAEFAAFTQKEFDRWSQVAKAVRFERVPLAGK